MNSTKIIPLVLLAVISVGCSEKTESEPPKPAFRPEVFEPVNRAATELQSAQDVGMNRQRFGELLGRFATEVSLVKSKADSEREQRVILGYSEALQIYKDAAAIWDVKLQIPALVDLAQEESKMQVAAGSVGSIGQFTDFKIATIHGIPLNLYPEGSTGIDDYATHYQLPVTESDGWKTIPNDSVERIWSKARTKTEEVIKLQNGQ